MSDQIIRRLLTNKASIGETRVDKITAPYSCEEGDVVLKIRHVAITTNNITYAAFGDVMQYWHFFPTGMSGWGHMPAWGFADVVKSTTEGIKVGERFYGYFPIASHVIMRPTRVTSRGFYDHVEHRQALVSVYNQYSRCAEDAGYDPDKEHYHSLLRPLFITSYMLAGFLEDNDFFGARRVVISSASSKTAYGTAYCLKLGDADVGIVGLTSSGNIKFVESLGCYDRVLGYADIAADQTLMPTLYVDFSGSNTVRASVHNHYGDHLMYDCFVGSTQNTEFLQDDSLPGPKPEFFFAPTQIKKRNQELGGAEANRRYNLAQKDFIDCVADTSQPWMRLNVITSFEGAGALIKDLCAGRVDPLQGTVVELN